METTKYTRRTGAGTVHTMTAGKGYTLRGHWLTNDPANLWGKADCGALVSTAASPTEEPVNCAKCEVKA